LNSVYDWAPFELEVYFSLMNFCLLCPFIASRFVYRGICLQ